MFHHLWWFFSPFARAAINFHNCPSNALLFHFMMPIALDAIDRRILDALQTDCSPTNQELAAHVHTSAATCLRRVKRLVDAGVIERRIAILAPARADLGTPTGLTAVIEVTLDRQAAELQTAFEERAVADSDVQQCYRVTPGPDFVLIAYVADTVAYQSLAQRLFTSDANVRNVRTYFAVSRSKFEPRVPVLAPSHRTEGLERASG